MKTGKISIGILGSSGRMGTVVQNLLKSEFEKQFTVLAQVDHGDSLDPLLNCNVVIDFSLPEGGVAFAQKAIQTGKCNPWVIASTGWSNDQRKWLESYAEKGPVLMASNFSLGVLAFSEILRLAAPLLDRLGYQPAIVEAHHKHKKDAPSGTAKSLQRIISPEGPGNVPTYSIRAGEVIGDHEVGFYGSSDRIVLKHEASDRAIFARGAILAAEWLVKKFQSKKTLTGMQSLETFFRETYVNNE